MQQMVRVAALTGYVALLAEHKVDARQLLADLSLPPDYLERPDRLIPVTTKVDLLELGARATGCRHFGLLLGRQQNISTLGLVGLLVQQSGTMREALVTIGEQIGRHVQGLEVRLVETGDQASWHFTYQVDDQALPSRQHSDHTLMVAYNIITFLHGEPFKLRAAYLVPRMQSPICACCRHHCASIAMTVRWSLMEPAWSSALRVVARCCGG